MASFSSLKTAVFSREHRNQHYKSHVLGLNAYERHKKFMDDYIRCYGKQTMVPSGSNHLLKTDQDTLRETYRFIRSEEDDHERSWEQRLAKRYYDKLFKEYCIADMSRYKENKVGLRWRTDKEVVSGKGQFVCGNKKCSDKEDLHSYEVSFSYKEAGEMKQALVKLRVCPRCAYKLNYKKEREKKRQLRQQEKENKKRKRKEEEHDGVIDSELENEFNTSLNRNQMDKQHVGTERQAKDFSKAKRGHSPSVSPPAKEEANINQEFEDYFTGMFL